MIVSFILLLNLFLLFFTLLSGSLEVALDVYFYSLIIIIGLDYLDNKSVTLLQTWLLAFIFIILSEALLSDSLYYSRAIKYLLTANSIFIFGYFIPIKYKSQQKTKNYIMKVRPSKWVLHILVLMLLIYLFVDAPRTINQFIYGRKAIYSGFTANGFFAYFIEGLAFMLPALFAYYFIRLKNKKTIVIPLIFSLPVFITLFFKGTRFNLLFSFAAFLIITQLKHGGKLRINTQMIILVLLLIGSTILMKEFRQGGLISAFTSNNTESVTRTSNSTRLSEKLASNMSPEGVIDMTDLMMTHFDSNPHMLGKSSLFLAYFWVPRKIWPEKPTMLGNWLIRLYRGGFGESHSASFGFTGDLYADFGYFSLLIVFILGILLKVAEHFKNYAFHSKGYNVILGAMFYPYVFFFVRSPITSTMNFLGIIFFYYFFKRLFFTEQRL